MANVQIYQLDNAGSDLDNSALLAMDIPNPDVSAASEVPYVTRKESIASLETQMLQTDEYTTALDTTSKKITGAINELNTNKADSSDITITEVTSLLGTLESGYSIVLNESAIYKQNNHVFGSLLIKSTNNIPTGNVTNKVLTFASAYTPNKTINTFGVTSDNQYNNANSAYIYIGGELYVKTNSSNQTIIKVQLDYCT